MYTYIISFFFCIYVVLLVFTKLAGARIFFVKVLQKDSRGDFLF